MKKGTYFENLDAIRFIAALMVIIAHTVKSNTGYQDIKNIYLHRFLSLISDGGTGVSIFFVLSGFLITYLLIMEDDKYSEINIKNFYIRRVLRIWPLYFMVLLFAFVIYPFIILPNGHFSYNILYFITFLSNFDVMHVLTRHGESSTDLCGGVTWSVSVEEQFYLFWPLIFTFLPRKLWVYSIILTILISLLFRMSHPDDLIVLSVHTLSVLIFLGVGGLSAYMAASSTSIKSFFEKTSTISLSAFMALSVLSLIMVEYTWKYQYGRALSPVFTSVSFALVICSQAFTKSQSIMNLRNLSFATKWGKYTYGMYLLHPIAYLITGIFFDSIRFPRAGYINIIIVASFSFILTLALSKLSYVYFESKFLQLKAKFEMIKTENPQVAVK